MSRYLQLARRAATREEHHKTNEGRSRKESPVSPPLAQTRISDHEPNETYEKSNPPVTERDKSDISDRSPDYRAVLGVLRDPPYWLRDSYLAGYRQGTITLYALSAAVAAALGRSPYEWTEQLVPLVEQALEKEARPFQRAPANGSGCKSGARDER